MVDDPLDTSDMETASSRLKRTLGEWRDAGAPTDSLVLLLEGFVACKVAEMLKQHVAYTAQETCEQCSGAKRTSDGLNCTACNAMGESTEKTKVQATILPCGCDIAKTAKWIRRECGCLPRERDLRGDPTDI